MNEDEHHYVDVDTVGDAEVPLYYGYEGNPVDGDKQLENIRAIIFRHVWVSPKMSLLLGSREI
ncbi:hypothetical protein [Oceanobacillus sojae]|uniref:hypothetical protein n=1 Tax=Oceanobacillus sojae TaxID=582851 RepID=UPI00098876A0|nr:hypothetical protein [Oceanobacillus sojae]